jgi:hypothetical protein
MVYSPIKMTDKESNEGTLFDQVYKNLGTNESISDNSPSSNTMSGIEKKISNGINSVFYSNFKKSKLLIHSISKKINKTISNTYHSIIDYKVTIPSLKLSNFKKEEYKLNKKDKPKQTLGDRIDSFSSDKKGIQGIFNYSRLKKPLVFKDKFKKNYLKEKKFYKPLIIFTASTLLVTAVYRNWNFWDSNKINQKINASQIITNVPKVKEIYSTTGITNLKPNLENILWDSKNSSVTLNPDNSSEYLRVLDFLDIKKVILGKNSFSDSDNNYKNLINLLTTRKQELSDYVSSHNNHNREVSLSLVLSYTHSQSLFDYSNAGTKLNSLSDTIWDKDEIQKYKTEPKFVKKVKNPDFLKRFDFESGPDFSKMKTISSYPLIFSLYNNLEKPSKLFSSDDDMADYFTKRIENPEVMKSCLPALENLLFSSQAFKFIDNFTAYNNFVRDNEQINSFILTTDMYANNPDKLSQLNNYLLLKLVSSVKEYSEEKGINFLYVLPKNPNRSLAYEQFSDSIDLKKENINQYTVIFFGNDFNSENIDRKPFYEHANDLLGDFIIPSYHSPEYSSEEQSATLFKYLFPFTKSMDKDEDLYFTVNLPKDNSNLTETKNSVINLANLFDNQITGSVIYKR